MSRLFIGILLVISMSVYGGTPQKTKRVLTLGMRNESNTFSTAQTKETDFQVLRGQDALKGAEWAKVCKDAGVELIPTLHAYAWPGGVVERVAFEKFKKEILDGIRKAGHLDGIFMEMHGAFHAVGYADAQATLIREIRDIVGEEVLISGSFDLHGNPSPEFVEHINMLSAFRTAPHRDEEETKVRAVKLLIEAMEKKLKPHIECVAIPILVPGEKSITEIEPLGPIYAQLPIISSEEGIMDASIFAGYCWADLPRSAMRVFVVAEDKSYQGEAKAEAIKLARQIWDCRAAMQLDVPSGSFEAMLEEVTKYKDKSVFISDSGDNTTAGAPGDNTQVLEILLKHQVKNVLVAGIVDPAAFEGCMAKKVDDSIALSLGAKVDYKFSKPLEVQGKILYLSLDSANLNKRGAALLDINGIYTVVLNARRSFTEIRDFKDIGLDPLNFKIVIVKLGYLFPELRDIAPVHLMALTSGFCNLDMRTLPFKNVNRPIYPLDLDMSWSPQ